MIIGHTVDSMGYFTGDVLSDSGIIPDVAVICPDGFFSPRWDGYAWVEGLTSEEIAERTHYPTKYQDDRRAAYPPIGDQLDAIWKHFEPVEGTEAAMIKEAIIAVKAAYPKPEGYAE